MSSTFLSSSNKKNLRLKNIIFMSPLSRTKLNIPNLISETKRNLTNNNKYSSNNVSNYNNKSNKIFSEIYRSYSTNRHIKHYNKKIKKNINSISINKFSFSKLNFCIKKIKNKKFSSFKTGIKNSFKKNNNSEEKKNKFIDILFSNNNSSYSSHFFNKKYSNSSNKKQKQKFKQKIKNEINKRNKNSFSSFNSLNHENFSEIFGLKKKNNIKKYSNDLNKKKDSKSIKSQNLNKIKYINKLKKTIQLQRNIISTFKSNSNKNNIKSINLNLSNDIIIIKKIENPEELHFFYINIIQNGKQIENKFEESIINK